MAFKERSTLFSARQRSVYILFDGKKTVAHILAATAVLGVTRADVDHLTALGFLIPVAEPVVPEPTPAAVAEKPATLRVGDAVQDTPVDRWTMF